MVMRAAWRSSLGFLAAADFLVLAWVARVVLFCDGIVAARHPEPGHLYRVLALLGLLVGTG